MQRIYLNLVGSIFALSVFTLGCGKQPLTHRTVDVARGTGYQLGAPKNRMFSAEIATAHSGFNIRVYEQSECDRIRFKLVDRREEAMRGEEVVEVKPMGPAQIVEATEPAVPCNDRFATGAEVSLSAGTATYILGRADRFGMLEANLSEELKHSLYGEKAAAQMKVLVERKEVATISMAELAKHDQRVGALAAELKNILDQPVQAPPDVSRSYVLYEQLQQLDPNGAEIGALSARFFEVVYQRKQAEATQQFKRNLEALKGAKELLSIAGAGAIPSFIRASVNSGSPSGDAVQWALGEIALTTRSNPALCKGGFTWSQVTAELKPGARIAFSIAQYQYNDEFLAQMQGLCGR